MDAVATIKENTKLTLAGSMLKTLAYFDIFDYPLQLTEIKSFCEQDISLKDCSEIASALVAASVIFKLNDFYSLRDDLSLAERRVKGNKKAKDLLPNALRIGRFLYQFPFVRAIAISGSLSKNFADDHGDIDFFILTKSNRLWIARTFMHLFKKFTYPFGKQHLFCMNYYLDETALELDERNIYTATEIKTLVTVAGVPALQLFFSKNSWTDEWLPYFSPECENSPVKISTFKKFFEWGLGNRAGEKLDNYLFRLTTSRWLKKESRGKKNIKGKVMNLLTSKHVARSNPDFYQERLINIYENKMAELKLRWPRYFA